MCIRDRDYIKLVEDGDFDVIYADRCMERMTPKFGGTFVDTVHFAVSGRLAAVSYTHLDVYKRQQLLRLVKM